MLYLIPYAHVANHNALHAGQTSQDAIYSLQPTKMSGIFKGYLRDSQRRLDEFHFQIQPEIWWPCHFQLPSSVWKEHGGMLHTCLILRAQVVWEGAKIPFWSACSQAIANQHRGGTWCMLSWWLKGSSSTLIARLLGKDLKVLLCLLLQYMVWLENTEKWGFTAL